MTDRDPGVPKRPAGVMAAPNSSKLTVRILSMNRSKDFPDKWELELNIKDLSSENKAAFAQKGQMVQGFSFENMQQFNVGDTVSADAEFIGGPEGGLFNLTNVSR